MPIWMQRYVAPSFSACIARSIIAGLPMRSIMSFAPYFRAEALASLMVASSAAARMLMMSAPAFAAISVSRAPVSMVFISATMVVFGNCSRSWRMMSMPSLFISGVPASNQSAPPLTASFAMVSALSALRRSNATCKTGFIEKRIDLSYLKSNALGFLGIVPLFWLFGFYQTNSDSI